MSISPFPNMLSLVSEMKGLAVGRMFFWRFRICYSSPSTKAQLVLFLAHFLVPSWGGSPSCLPGDIFIQRVQSPCKIKTPQFSRQILTQAVTLVYFSNSQCLQAQQANKSGYRKLLWCLKPLFVLCSSCLFPIVWGWLVKKHSAVDKAKGFYRIQSHFTFPLEEFILIVF